MTSSRIRPSTTRRLEGAYRPRPPRPDRPPRAASGAWRRRARGRARRHRRRARRTRRPRAGAAAGPSRPAAARAAPRRTGWPDRPRPGGGPRPTPRSSAGSRTARSRSRAPGQRELGRPEPVDEVAAPDAAGVLHRPEDRVDGREPAVDPFGGDRLAGQDAVALEQGQAQGVEPLGRSGDGSGVRRDERPAAGGLGRAQGGEPAGPADGPPGAAAGPLPAQGPQRRERVVGDLAGPDEVPQRVEDLAVRVPAGRREELAVERGAARRQVLADGDVARFGSAARRRRACRSAAGSRDPAGRARSGRRRGRGSPAPPRPTSPSAPSSSSSRGW